MNEIEKLYKNAGIEPIVRDNAIGRGYYIEHQRVEEYPPFTAEKQLAIFKMFCRRYLEVSQHAEENGDLCFGIKATVGDYAVGFNKDFEECLADFVNYLWQDLTEEEKEQIRGILK